MNKLKYLSFLLLIPFILLSCSPSEDRPWVRAVPEKAPFIIIPAENTTLRSVTEAPYSSLVDGVTTSAITPLKAIDSTTTSRVNLNGLILYPGAENRLEAIWIGQAPDGFSEELFQNYYRDFSQNKYHFQETTIHKLQIEDQILFTATLNDLLLLSESSLGLEDAIRAYSDSDRRADLTHIELQPGHVIMNTPSLREVSRQIAKVTYHPALNQALRGTKPALLSISDPKEEYDFQLFGTIPLAQEQKSTFIEIISDTNAPISLDQYISSSAAAFGIFRQSPSEDLPDSLPDTSHTDSMFISQPDRYTSLSEPLGTEFAVSIYAESGFLTTGEHIFVRKLDNPVGFREMLNNLADDGHAEAQDGIYFIQSRILAQLIGSSLSSFPSFYLSVIDDVVAISKRRELTEIISDDKERRRTIYYERTFRDIKEDLPEEISGLFVTNENFGSLIDPFTYPDSYLNTILNRSSFLTLSASLTEESDSLQFYATSYRWDEESEPYEENWIFPLQSELSGEVVVADISGSSRNEIIFASPSGSVYALSADGNRILEANTGSDTPIGSPVVYDWYGTDKNVILLAAGNKIYGWDENGDLLPRFPFALDETITSPLVVTDVNGNGLPNALVATADRKLHTLNGRGNNINGWPVTTNTQITARPVVEEFMNSKTIVAFSGNGVHAWEINGSTKEGFPRFTNAPINGSPQIFEDYILANAEDGNLYAMGADQLFPNSQDASNSSGSSFINISSSPLTGTPSVSDMRVRSDGQLAEGTMIVTADANGSFYILDSSGQLLSTQNIGQPVQQNFSPLTTDINEDSRKDILMLTNAGRLLGWQVTDGTSLNTLPSNSMQYPVINDVNGDGYPELIAFTNEGVISWTLFE